MLKHDMDNTDCIQCSELSLSWNIAFAKASQRHPLASGSMQRVSRTCKFQYRSQAAQENPLVPIFIGAAVLMVRRRSQPMSSASSFPTSGNCCLLGQNLLRMKLPEVFTRVLAACFEEYLLEGVRPSGPDWVEGREGGRRP